MFFASSTLLLSIKAKRSGGPEPLLSPRQVSASTVSHRMVLLFSDGMEQRTKTIQDLGSGTKTIQDLDHTDAGDFRQTTKSSIISNILHLNLILHQKKKCKVTPRHWTSPALTMPARLLAVFCVLHCLIPSAAYMSPMCCGDNFCCSVDTSGGTVSCWGGNDFSTVKAQDAAVRDESDLSNIGWIACAGKSLVAIDRSKRIVAVMGKPE